MKSISSTDGFHGRNIIGNRKNSETGSVIFRDFSLCFLPETFNPKKFSVPFPPQPIYSFNFIEIFAALAVVTWKLGNF